MKKLAEVQAAKNLMKEAMEWSTLKWVWEKQRVRETAHAADAALDRLNRSTKAKWSEDCRRMYKKLPGKKQGDAEAALTEGETSVTQMEVLVEEVLKADHAAKHAKQVAEETFDEAEKRLSVDLAREGCKKAIHSWELHEKAIRKAEAVMGEIAAGSPQCTRVDQGKSGA